MGLTVRKERLARHRFMNYQGHLFMNYQGKQRALDAMVWRVLSTKRHVLIAGDAVCGITLKGLHSSVPPPRECVAKCEQRRAK